MLFSSFWKRGPGPPLWGPGGVLGPLDPPLDPPQSFYNYYVTQDLSFTLFTQVRYGCKHAMAAVYYVFSFCQIQFKDFFRKFCVHA